MTVKYYCATGHGEKNTSLILIFLNLDEDLSCQDPGYNVAAAAHARTAKLPNHAVPRDCASSSSG